MEAKFPDPKQLTRILYLVFKEMAKPLNMTMPRSDRYFQATNKASSLSYYSIITIILRGINYFRSANKTSERNLFTAQFLHNIAKMFAC